MASEIKQLVRVVKTDLDGNKQVLIALSKIKGVNYSFANATCSILGIQKSLKIGSLNEQQIEKINDLLTNPKKYQIPTWLFNRKRDYTTNEDKHLLLNDLSLTVENDIKLMKNIKSYKGIRHGKGLPVRGQRTRSNFRKNKGKITLGVIKKKVVAQTAKEEKKE